MHFTTILIHFFSLREKFLLVFFCRLIYLKSRLFGKEIDVKNLSRSILYLGLVEVLKDMTKILLFKSTK